MKIIKIYLKDYTLDAFQIDNLASEYYGTFLQATGREETEEDDFIEYEFPDANTDKFLNSLNGCFLIK